MGTRKQFVAAAAASVGALAAAPALAQTEASTPASAATPSSKPSPKVSAAARQLAEQMRRFDPQLSEKNIADIAEGIDGNFKLGARTNPKGSLLKNWDEPVTIFEVKA